MLYYSAIFSSFLILSILFILNSQVVAAAEEFHKEAMSQCKSLEIINSNAAAATTADASDGSSNSSGTTSAASTVGGVSVPLTGSDSSASTSGVAGDTSNNSTATSSNSRETVTRKGQDKTKKSKTLTVCVRLGQEPQFLVLGKRY